VSFTTLIQNAFSGGELSPLLEGRIDLSAYRGGARIMENFLPMRQGPLRRRPGSYHAGETRRISPLDPTLKARLVEFIDTSGANWVIELTDLKARVFSLATHAVVGAPTELVTTITEAELFQARYALNAGSLWITHHNHKVQRIDYNIGTATWSISEPTFTGVTFDSATNYPAVCAFHAGRLLLAATDTAPTGIWLSCAPDSTTGADRYTDFTIGTTAEAAIFLMESNMGGTAIRWAMSARKAILATSRMTWAETDASKPTPADFDLDGVAYGGSADVQGAHADNMMAYVSANGKALRIMIFSLESGGWQDIEITRACEHILKPGIIDLRVQTDPETIIWLVRSDGALVSMIVDTTDSIVAGSRHVMGGGGIVESIAVVRGQNGDEIWLSVLRGETRSIEYMYFRQDTDISCLHFVDDGLALAQGSTTITGLAHLEGAVVAAAGDGATLPLKTVSGGSVTYDRAVYDLHIGHPFSSTLLMVRPEVPAQGTSQGKKKRIEEITLRLFNSAGGSIGQTMDGIEPMIYLVSGTYTYGTSPGLYTGDIKVDFSGRVDEDADVYIVQEDPMPLTLLATMTKIAIMEV